MYEASANEVKKDYFIFPFSIYWMPIGNGFHEQLMALPTPLQCGLVALNGQG